MNNQLQILITTAIFVTITFLTAILFSGCDIPTEFLEEEAIKVEEDLYKEQKGNDNKTTQSRVKTTVNTTQKKK